MKSYTIGSKIEKRTKLESMMVDSLQQRKENRLVLNLYLSYFFIVGLSFSSFYLSNRPQVSMGYKLINHAGCW